MVVFYGSKRVRVRFEEVWGKLWLDGPNLLGHCHLWVASSVSSLVLNPVLKPRRVRSGRCTVRKRGEWARLAMCRRHEAAISQERFSGTIVVELPSRSAAVSEIVGRTSSIGGNGSPRALAAGGFRRRGCIRECFVARPCGCLACGSTSA